MNLRFWGGWFLVLAGIGIVLTMGCEKGALGVKPAVVMGKVVDSDNTSIAVSGALVRMMSMEAVGASELKQGNTYASTITDADGMFVFENVTPDNVVFEIEASGYAKKEYPETTAATSDTGETTTAAKVDKVYVKSGSVTNLGLIGLRKITNPLPETITAAIVLRDSKTLEILDESAGPVTISFNNQTITLPVSNWKDGIDLTGNPITLKAESSFKVMVRANPNFYLSKEQTIAGTGDIQTDFLLDPVSYNLLLRCTNVPDYIQGGVVNVFAESIPTNLASPPKVIATHTIDDLGDLTQPNLPEVIQVPGLALPVNLRINVRGYEDEVLTISQSNLPAGTQGTYRIDVNFLNNNGTRALIYDPVLASQAGLLDNRMKRDVVLEVAGPHLLDGDVVNAAISLPSGAVTYDNGVVVSATPVACSNNMPVRITFADTAVGYNMDYVVSIYPSVGSPSYASGSYTISSADPIMINPVDDVPASALLIGVNAERPNN
ncbi:MAG: hypothetical protein Kow0029_10730 [Candidatus Rifleibacteriota bacterium]